MAKNKPTESVERDLPSDAPAADNTETVDPEVPEGSVDPVIDPPVAAEQVVAPPVGLTPFDYGHKVD